MIPGKFSVAGMAMIALLGFGASALSGVPTEHEVLQLLPTGSVIAEIPLSVDHRGCESEKRKALLLADRVTGNPDTLLVGYYSQPDPKIGPDQELPSGFYTRAHVALIINTEKEAQVVWDSGGWGFQFGMERTGKPFTREQCCFLFDITDLNGDGENEVAFARLSFRAEGSRFEIWDYDKEEGRMVLLCAVPGLVTIDSSRSHGWPQLTSETFYAGTIHTVHFHFDADRGQYLADQVTVE